MVCHRTDKCIRVHLESKSVQVRLGVGTPPPHNGKIPDTPETKKQQQQQQNKEEEHSEVDESPCPEIVQKHCLNMEKDSSPDLP